MQLFGTDGIRGEFGTFLTPQLAYQVGQAIGNVWGDAQQGAILLGQDSRNSSPALAQQITAGLQTAGWQVWQLGLCPTPAVAYLTATHPHIHGGIMISASHNPPQDNGIKFFNKDGSKPSRHQQSQIEQLISPNHLPPTHPAPSIEDHQQPELLQQYQHSLIKSLDRSLSGLHLVLDLAWGSATRLTAQTFEALGAQVTCLHDQPNGDRINVNCGSTHLEPLQAAILAYGADLGFAFDGDADRVLAVDKQGHSINGDHILYLWGSALLAKGMLPSNAIVSTVMANLGFERAWQTRGGKLHRTPVGDQYVHREMLQTGAMLGGEQSGHILCRHHSISGDGLMTALHLAALAQEHQEHHLSHLLADSFTPFPQVLKNVKIADKDKRCNWHTCTPLIDSIRKAESQLGNQGRILIRASGTEPVIRIMVEAETQSLSDRWSDYLTQAVLSHLVS